MYWQSIFAAIEARFFPFPVPLGVQTTSSYIMNRIHCTCTCQVYGWAGKKISSLARVSFLWPYMLHRFSLLPFSLYFSFFFFFFFTATGDSVFSWRRTKHEIWIQREYVFKFICSTYATRKIFFQYIVQRGKNLNFMCFFFFLSFSF